MTASVRFFIYSVASFLLCYPCEALEGPICKGLRKNLTTLIQKQHILMRTAVLYTYIYIYIHKVKEASHHNT